MASEDVLRRMRADDPPHAELLTYAYDPASSGTCATVAT